MSYNLIYSPKEPKYYRPDNRNGNQHSSNRIHLRTYPLALALSVGFLLNADIPVRIHATATQAYGMALPPVDLSVSLNL